MDYFALSDTKLLSVLVSGDFTDSSLSSSILSSFSSGNVSRFDLILLDMATIVENTLVSVPKEKNLDTRSSWSIHQVLLWASGVSDIRGSSRLKRKSSEEVCAWSGDNSTMVLIGRRLELESMLIRTPRYDRKTASLLASEWRQDNGECSLNLIDCTFFSLAQYTQSSFCL